MFVCWQRLNFEGGGGYLLGGGGLTSNVAEAVSFFYLWWRLVFFGGGMRLYLRWRRLNLEVTSGVYLVEAA